MSENSIVWNFIAKDKASAVANKMGESFQGLGGKIGAALGGAAVAGVGLLSAFLIKGVKDAADYQTLAAKTTAVLKSTGDVSHASVAGIQALAASLETMSGVDEVLIINSENVMATFTRVRNEAGKGNDVFNQATAAALDMSVALGTDLQGATIQIGKALQDPIKGVTALRKVGVALSEQQVSQIKTMMASGNVMGAQKVILKELGTEFGGAAKAAGSGFTGSLARARDILDDFGRSVGMKILPYVTEFTNWLADKLPGALQWASDATAVFIAALQGTDPTGPMAESFGKLATAGNLVRIAFEAIVAVGKALFAYYENNRLLVQSLGAALLAMYATYQVIRVATIAWAVAQGILNLALNLNPIGLIILLIAGLAAGLIYAYKHSEQFRLVVQTSMAAAVVAFRLVWNIVGAIVGYIHDRWNILYASLVQPIISAVSYIIGRFIAVKNGAADAVNGVIAWFQGLPSRIRSALGNLGNLLVSAGRDTVNGLLNGARNVASNVISWASGIKDAIVRAVKHAFGINSPSTVFMDLGVHMITGLIKGLMSTNAVDIVKTVFGSMPDALGALVTKSVIGFGSLTSGAMGALSKVKGFFGSMFGGGGGGGGGAGVERWRGVAEQALAYTHSPPNWINALLRRMNQESGGNQMAINLTDSNAAAGDPSRGLMQTIGGTFNAYAGELRGRGIYDPFANIVASIRYANAAYGQAINGWNRAGGYDTGGWLMPGWTPAFNGTGRPERVLGPGDGGGGATVNFVHNGPLIGDDVDSWLVRKLDRLARRGRLS